MIQHDVIVQHRYGLHLRPASMLTQIAASYESKITLEYNGFKAKCCNLLGILKLGIEEGSQITFIIEGPDEDEALKQLVEVFKSNQHK